MLRSAPLVAVLILALTFAGFPAAADDPPPTQDLEVWLADGMDPAEVDWALETDLGSGIAGALPVALIEAVIELDPERYGTGGIGEAYRRYGFLFLRGRPELPIGMVEVSAGGVRFHNFNCLACHAGSETLPAPGGPKGFLVMGATNRTIDLTGWYLDLLETVRTRLREERTRLAGHAVSGLRLRANAAEIFVAAARRARERRGESLGLVETLGLTAFIDMQVDYLDQPLPAGIRYGPGRTLVQGAYRTLRFGLPPGDYAPVKAPDLFGVRHRSSLLWGANETYEPSVPPWDRIGRNGLLVPWIQLHPVTRQPVPDALALLRLPLYQRMGRLLQHAAPPPVPAPATGLERARFARGRTLYETTCTPCHGRYEFDPEPLPDGTPGLASRPVAYAELLPPLDVLGTDPNYAAALDDDYARAWYRTLYYQVDLFGSRKTGTYVARPHLGLRLRAPYLHNASVPSLEALLTPPGDRPLRFRVGRSVPLDGTGIGLEVQSLGHDEDDPARGVHSWDGRTPGNRPMGHPFGTDLAPEDKLALIEYLKRL